MGIVEESAMAQHESKKEMRVMIESIGDVDFLPVYHCERDTGEYCAIINSAYNVTVTFAIDISFVALITRMRFSQLTLIATRLKQILFKRCEIKNELW